MRNRSVVAIVGGGSIGVSFLAQLVAEAIACQCTDGLEIIMFEPQCTAGPGYAYQDDFPGNLLNTRADTMSALASDKAHFLTWLKRHRAEWETQFPHLTVTPDAFLPRSLFGQYLADTFASTVAMARAAGISFRQVSDKVVDLVACYDGDYYIDTNGSGAFHASRIVLCCGNLDSTNFPALVGAAHFYNNPYPGRKFGTSVDRDASVCVLGTNLSAIDTVISLIEGGHRGKIICASRNGRLPSVRGTLNDPITLQFVTRQRIDDIIAANGGKLNLLDVSMLIKCEYERCTGSQLDLEAIMNRRTGVYDYLSTEIDESASQQRFWQSVIYATNSIVDYIWHKLDLAEKRVFQSSVKALWYSYRVSFPIENARKIREYMRTDRMSVFGGLTDIRKRADDGVFELKIVDMRSGFRSTIECDVVINATSYSTDVTQTDDPLVRNLLRRRLAQANEFGGFELDFDSGRLISPDRRCSRGISVLGSLATGAYFWTNAMDVNARLAHQQAHLVVSELSDVRRSDDKAIMLAPTRRPLRVKHRAAENIAG